MTTLTHTESTHEMHHENDAKVVFGFWIYIMTDCLLFASLFATHAVLRGNTFGGASGSELFSLPYAFLETMILLTSSFTAGLGMLAAHKGQKNNVLAWFFVTLLLGLTFIGLELNEFTALAREGHDWTQNGFLSSFFTLVGTHGLHVFSGIIWMLILLAQIATKGLTTTNLRRLVCLSLFWHFLDIVWIFIFTYVYLISAI
jgi:cytochrome o ubiquinol oxidase subunit III